MRLVGRSDNTRWRADSSDVWPLPGHFQTVPFAEHYALLQVVRAGGRHLSVFSDCQTVVDGHALGGGACHRSKYFGGLWRDVHAALACRGTDIEVKKVKAHTTDFFPPGSTEAWLQAGNRLADEHAKEGAQKHTLTEGWVADWHLHRDQNLQVLQHIIACLEEGLSNSWWISADDTQLRKDLLLLRGSLGESLLADPRGDDNDAEKPRELQIVHHAWVRSIEGVWQCTDCRRWAQTSAHKARLDATPCMPIRAVAHSSHELCATSVGVLFCNRCGAYVTKNKRNLLKPCPLKSTVLPSQD